VSFPQFDAHSRDHGNVAKQRSWPLVLIGAVVALAVGALLWAVWLAPGQPTVDQPVVTASASPSAEETPEQTDSANPSATPTVTPTVSASPTPTDEVDNPIDDAIVGYPGSPIKPSAVARDIVRVIQQRIADLGTKLTVDGVYGTRTTAAVKAFQKDNGLPVTGIVDRDTWAALFTSDS
jgi:murein L,D-transpeptidase YcbB/YkuD